MNITLDQTRESKVQANNADRQLHYIAGAMAVAGAALMIPLQVMNPQPDEPGNVTSYFVAVLGSPYQALYLAIAVVALVFAIGMACLAATLRNGPAMGWATLALVTAPLGGAVAVVLAIVAAVALVPLVEAWEASGHDPTAFAVASGVWWILRALFIAFVLTFLGATITLLGIAVAKDRRHPAWLGWLGTAIGVAAIVVAIAMGFQGQTLVVDYRIFPVVAMAATLWVITIGVLTWRRAPAAQDTA